MRTVALTGSAASGKSTVAEVWREEGIPVVSADALAREAVAPGSPGLREVVEAFGEEYLRPDGTLHRARLRKRVFGDEEARRLLEGILHPRIAALRDRWMEERRREGAELVAAEIPLLFETGGKEEFDVVVVVDAPREACLRRLTEDRGLEREEAEGILAAQMDPEEKRRRADHVVGNRGTLEELREEARALLRGLRKERG